MKISSLERHITLNRSINQATSGFNFNCTNVVVSYAAVQNLMKKNLQVQSAFGKYNYIEQKKLIEK